MPQHLSQLEALTISHWFNLVARDLTDAASQDGLSVSDVKQLTESSDQIASVAANLAANAVQTVFKNADTAFGDISDAASQAANTADRMSKQIAQVNNLLSIGAAMFSFGVDVLTGNYGAALSALVKLVGQPTKGQGANAP
jgi:hypothetical protein